MKLPRYQQVCNDLIEQIQTGLLAPDSKLPSDEELESKYQTSRITIQRALQEVVQAGLLRRVRGHGTYVLSPAGLGPGTLAQDRESPVRFIAVIFPQGESHGAHNILMGIEETFFEGGFLVGIKNSRESSRSERLILESLLGQRPSGVILFPSSESYKNTDLISRFLAQRIPLVMIDRKATFIETPFVACDNRDGARTLTDYLIAQGRRRIAFVCSSLDDISSEQERFAGYCQSLTQAGLGVDMDLVLTTEVKGQERRDRSNEERLCEELLERNADAVFAVNDLWAIALTRQFRTSGIPVPQRIAVVGFDDIEFAKLARPGITTYSQPFHEIGAQAGRILREIMEGTRNQSDPLDVRIKGRLVIRESA